MSQISCRACGVFIKTLEERLILPSRLVEGMDVTLDYLRDPENTISLADYHRLAERFSELLDNAPAPSLLNHILPDMNWQYVLSTLKAVVSIIDANGIVLYINRIWGGRRPEDIIGKPVFDILPDAYRQSISKNIAWVMQYGDPIRQEMHFVSPDRFSDRWFENQLMPLRQDNKIVGVLVMSIDITDRKTIEHEIQKRAVQLETVAEVSSQIKSMFDVPHLIRNVCDLVKESFNLYHAHIFLMDENGERLVAEYGAGAIGQRLVESRHSFQLIDGVQGIVPKAARERRIVVSNNVKEDPYWRYNPLLPDTESEMAIPIMVGDQLVGVLDVQAVETNFFSDDDQRVQAALADQIAIAIQNAQLYENIVQQWEIAVTLRDIGLILASTSNLREVLQRTLREIVRVLDYDAAHIWITDENKNRRIMASIGYERFGLTVRQIEEMFAKSPPPAIQELDQLRKVVILPDVQRSPLWIKLPQSNWIRSYASAPLIVRDEVVGYLILDHTQAGHYQPHHEPIMEVLARQIALAVENTRLLEGERDQREMAETLRDIGSVLASSLEQEDILQLVLAQVARVVPYDAAAIWLDDGSGVFRSAAQFGYDRFNAEERIRNLRFAPDDRYYPAENESVVVPDTYADPEWLVIEGFEWVRSWAVAPIIIRDRIIGNIALDHTQPHYFNTNKHKAVLEVLATQISIAVGNAQLFEAERRRRLQIEALQRGNMSLISSLQLSDVLDAILEAAFDIVPARDALIYLYENGELLFGAGVENNHKHIPAPSLPPRPNGLTYTVARTGQMLSIEDASLHPLYKGDGEKRVEKISSVIGIPLKFGNRVVGVMVLTFLTQRDFRAVETDSLQLLSNQASIAIENARLYSEVQNYANEMELRVVERTIELEQERAQLQVVLDSIGDGVIYNEDHEVKYINQMLADMTGMRLSDMPDYKELLTRILAESEDGEAIEQIDAAIQKGGRWQGELRMQRGDGREFDAMVIVSAVNNALGGIRGMVTIVRDISQEKALQEQKDRFIAHASHELRTPLTNIQTRLYLLRRRPDKSDEHLQVIEDVADQMAMLVQELLDISRFERGVIRMEREPVVLQRLINEVVRVQTPEAERKSLTLTAHVSSSSVVGMLDPQRIRQVLTNLITNAISYTENGGQVDVYFDVIDDHIARIQVKDTGIGIPLGLRDQVFQPFFRASEGMASGTGLGLSITKEIIEAHGGTIRLESEEDRGTTFIIELPLNEKS